MIITKYFKIYLILFLSFSNHFKGQNSDILLKELTVSTKDFINNRPPMQGKPGFFLEDWEEKKNQNLR